ATLGSTPDGARRPASPLRLRLSYEAGRRDQTLGKIDEQIRGVWRERGQATTAVFASAFVLIALPQTRATCCCSGSAFWLSRRVVGVGHRSLGDPRCDYRRSRPPQGRSRHGRHGPLRAPSAAPAQARVKRRSRRHKERSAITRMAITAYRPARVGSSAWENHL